MLDKNKVRIMSRLAIYDKKYGAVDRKKSGYFKWDYIYFRNFWTRLGVFFGCMIIALLYTLNKIMVEQVDIFALDMKLEATRIAFFTILALVVFTIIGTQVAKAEYKKSKERLDAYFSMLDKLDKISSRAKIPQEEQLEPAQGSSREYAQARERRATYKTSIPNYQDSEFERQADRQKKTFSSKEYGAALISKLKEVHERGKSADDDGKDDIWETDDYSDI